MMLIWISTWTLAPPKTNLARAKLRQIDICCAQIWAIHQLLLCVVSRVIGKSSSGSVRPGGRRVVVVGLNSAS